MQIAGDQVAWEMELGLIPRQIISEPVSFRHSFKQVCIKGEPRKLQQARMRSQILPTEVSLGCSAFPAQMCARNGAMGNSCTSGRG